MADTTLLHKLARQYSCGPVHFSGNERAWFERHLIFDHVVAPESASKREQFARRWPVPSAICSRSAG
jgi:hypothetical protein